MTTSAPALWLAAARADRMFHLRCRSAPCRVGLRAVFHNRWAHRQPIEGATASAGGRAGGTGCRPRRTWPTLSWLLTASFRSWLGLSRLRCWERRGGGLVIQPVADGAAERGTVLVGDEMPALF